MDGPINKVDGSAGMFLECKYEKWLDTSMACRRWCEQKVGIEEDGHPHHSKRYDGYCPECVQHHTDEPRLSVIIGTMIANYTSYDEGE